MCAPVLILGLTISLGGSAARAEPASPLPRVERRADGKVVYVAPPIVIEGKVQRPAAFFVLPRPQVSYSWPELQRPRPAPRPTPEP
jgi:hypothetical protein